MSNCDSNDSVKQGTLDNLGNNKHKAALENKENLLKFLHLNTQCLVSTFNESYITLTKYQFDLVAISETWLKLNKMLSTTFTYQGSTSYMATIVIT